MRLRRRVLAPVLLVGLVGLLLAGTTAVAEEHEPFFADIGELDLVLQAGNDAFEFTPAGSTEPTRFEVLSANNKCKLSQDGPDDLVDIAVTGQSGQGGNLPYAGLKDHQIGVRAKGEGTGTPCVRIDGGAMATDKQTLTIELGEFFGAEKFANYAQFGLKFKFGATAKVEAFNGEDLVDSDTGICEGSDCGPDSGGDRILLTVGSLTVPATLFDRIVISIVSPNDGAVTLLDAPADGYDTYFNIVQEFDGELACGDDVEASDGDVIGTVIRTGDPDNEGECGEIKPFNFDADDGANQIAFLPQGAPGAQYVARLEFGIAHAIGDPLAVVYDPLGGTAFQPLLACDVSVGSLPSTVSDALSTLGFDVSLLSGSDIAVPTGESWCEVGRTTYSVGGQYEDAVWAFGNDDPRWGGF